MAPGSVKRLLLDAGSGVLTPGRSRSNLSHDSLSTERSVVLDRLVKSYGSGFTLGPLNLRLEVGVTCIVGPNGAGKSTLLGLICGTMRPTSGSVTFPQESRRLGYLPQDFLLPQRATAQDFLSYAGWIQGVPKADRSGSVAQALAEVDLSEHHLTPIGHLSHGMAKRIAIAQTLVHDPGVLVLDEPTSGLDPIQRVGIRGVVSRLGASRVACVSTHLVEDVRGMADRVLVLSGGRLLYDGGVAELEARARPDLPGDTDLERALSSLMTSP